MYLRFLSARVSGNTLRTFQDEKKGKTYFLRNKSIFPQDWIFIFIISEWISQNVEKAIFLFKKSTFRNYNNKNLSYNDVVLCNKIIGRTKICCYLLVSTWLVSFYQKSSINAFNVLKGVLFQTKMLYCIANFIRPSTFNIIIN